MKHLFFVSCCLIVGSQSVGAKELPTLKVSDNGRFLVQSDGKPFFYLGDTAWELFHRLNREEAEKYLKNRADKKYTVIQAVILAELDGLRKPNPYGHVPFKNLDPTQPVEEYFQHVDWVINKAAELGLYVGLLPTWGDKVGPLNKWGLGPEVFTVENAKIYGEYVGKRYKDKPILWILGGDRNPDTDNRKAIWRAMAEGLKKGDGGRNLITYHPQGGSSSADFLAEEKYLDFHMWQTGHNIDIPVWAKITQDYVRKPIKPVVDGEPLYEDHPIGFNAKERGYSNAADIRRAGYWGVFAGSAGVTYGNHAVWQFYSKKQEPINGPLDEWFIAIDKPGAAQVQYLRALMESRPYLTRIPDQSLIASDASAGMKRIQATRDEAGTYAMLYIPASRTVRVNTAKLNGDQWTAWWYNPRTGKADKIGTVNKEPTLAFTPPDFGENLDWVLVLDDAAKKYPAPGTASAK